MTKAKKIKYLHDGVVDGHYVKAFAENRREYCVQVWATDKCEGEPKEEWLMPKVFGLSASIAQSILQTK